MKDPLKSPWLALAVLTIATLAATWPWSLTSASFPARDTAFTLLSLGHLQEVVLGADDLHRGPLAWPWEYGFTQSDWVVGQAILALPLRGLDPLLVHELLTLMGLVGTCWATWAVARALTGAGPHTWVAGALGGLHPLQLAHVQHLNLVHHEAAVLAGLALGLGLHRRQPWLAGLGGLTAALTFHLGFYLGMHALLVAGVVMVVALPAGRGSVRSYGAALAGLLVGGLTVLPIALAYQQAALSYEIGVDPVEVRGWSWRLGRTLAPIQGAPLHAPLGALAEALPPDPLSQRNPANPGYGFTVLALVGLVAFVRQGGRAEGRPRWPWVALALAALVAALLALGPDVAVFDPERPLAPGPYRLLQWIPGLGGLRAPARWLAVSFTALAPLAALGALTLTRRLPALWGALVAGALCLLPALESPPPPVAPAEAMAPPPIYAELAQVQAEGALWDEALVRNPECGCRGGHALRAAMDHRRPLAGGHHARSFAWLEEVDARLRAWPRPEAVEAMREYGVGVVLEHPPLARMEARSGVICSEFEEHRICVIEGRPSE